MTRILAGFIVSMLLSLLSALPATAVNPSLPGVMPQAASALGRALDRQIAARLQQEPPVQGVSLSLTVPVDVNNLESSNPLARQMAEELARWFSEAGYPIMEIRKGKSLLFDQEMGEMLLTRRVDHLADTEVRSAAVLAGTYTVTPQSVRFNIRIVHTGNLEVLGVAAITVPLTSDLKPLTRSGNAQGMAGMGIQPTVATTLP